MFTSEDTIFKRTILFLINFKQQVFKQSLILSLIIDTIVIRNQIVVLTISLSCILILIAAGGYFLAANAPFSTNGSARVKITLSQTL